MPATTTRLALPYPVGADPVNIAADIQALAVAIEAIKGIGPPIVTALTPGSQGIPNPVTNGFEVLYLADQTNGVVWHLRYRSLQSDGVTANPSAYKWEWIGGSSLYSLVTAQEAVGSPGTWINPTTVGPDVTVPQLGDYMVEFGVTQSVLNGAVQTGVAIGNTTPTDPLIYSYTADTSFANYDTAASRKLFTALAAASVLRMRYNGAVGGSVVRNRWMSVRPVRLG